MGEYKKNSSKEKKLLKKYGKYIRKAIVGGIIAAIGVFVIPGFGLGDKVVKLLPVLQKIIPDPFDAGATITVWSSIITSAIGTLKSAINGIKAHTTKEQLRDAIDLDEDLMDEMSLELLKEKEKNKNYENEISKLQEKKVTNPKSKVTNKSHDLEFSEKDASLEDGLHKIKK